MKYTFNPITGNMEQRITAEDEINMCVKRVSKLENMDSFTHIRENIIIGQKGGFRYLFVRLNTQWKQCGVITNYSRLARYFNGPVVSFYEVWRNGLQVKDVQSLYITPNKD